MNAPAAYTWAPFASKLFVDCNLKVGDPAPIPKTLSCLARPSLDLPIDPERLTVMEAAVKLILADVRVVVRGSSLLHGLS
jgi:hypothetical protein